MNLPGPYDIDPIIGMPTGGLDSVEKIIRFGINFLLLGSVLLALLFLVWGGLQWIMSGGDKSGLESARKKIIFSIVGLAIAFLAFAIINFFGQFIIGKNLVS